MSMTIEWAEETDDGDQIVHQLPAHYVVCDTCWGNGSIVNPAVDGHGLMSEDFEEDPDFRDDYFRGVYDVRCPTCKGLRVLLEIDDPPEDAGSDHVLNRYRKHLEQTARWDAEDRQTLYWESGGTMGSRY